MGYTTEFEGQIWIHPALNEHEVRYLEQFGEARHMKREQGPYYTGDDQHGVIAVNDPPTGQPGLNCDVIPTNDGLSLEWNGMEKSYYMTEWVRYIIDTFLKPGATALKDVSSRREDIYLPPEFAHFTFDHVLNGTMIAQGEDVGDIWTIVVRDNVVTRVEGHVADRGPSVIPGTVVRDEIEDIPLP